jgi:glycosyltransferase involved in cell wall biosynthesis
MLRGLGLAPAFIADDFRHAALPVSTVATGGVTSFRTALDWIVRNRASLRLVVLSRHAVARPWLPVIRDLLPGVPVVFDTVDLHHVRESRQAMRRGSWLLAGLARLTRRDERTLIATADRTWVVSPGECDSVRRLVPGARVDCVSNVVDRLGDPPSFEHRRDFVFLGNFRHDPNVDAVEWLLELWPVIAIRCPDARLVIIGPGLTHVLRARLAACAGIEVAGHVADIDPLLLDARVMLAPLRYGAGVKGKVNAAFAAGLPVVGTSCALEGMQPEGRPVALVAADDATFVEAAARAYNDAALWSSLQAAALDCVDRRFSSHAVEQALASSLRALGVDIGRHR